MCVWARVCTCVFGRAESQVRGGEGGVAGSGLPTLRVLAWTYGHAENFFPVSRAPPAWMVWMGRTASLACG